MQYLFQENVLALARKINKYGISEMSNDANVRKINSFLDTRSLSEYVNEELEDVREDSRDVRDKEGGQVGEGRGGGRSLGDMEEVCRKGEERGIGKGECGGNVGVVTEKKRIGGEGDGVRERMRGGERESGGSKKRRRGGMEVSGGNEKLLVVKADEEDREWLTTSRQIMLDVSK